jgi:hypothetical protein
VVALGAVGRGDAPLAGWKVDLRAAGGLHEGKVGVPPLLEEKM